MKRKLLLSSAFLILVPLGAAQAQVSGTATGSLEVLLRVTEACEVNGSASGGTGRATLDFGETQLLTSNVDGEIGTGGSGGIEVRCNPGVDYTVDFGPGENATEVSARAMAGPTGSTNVPYQLYSDAARSVVLTQVSDTGNGAFQSIPIYGRVPAISPAPAAGSYRDIVTVTVSF